MAKGTVDTKIYDEATGRRWQPVLLLLLPAGIVLLCLLGAGARRLWPAQLPDTPRPIAQATALPPTPTLAPATLYVSPSPPAPSPVRSTPTPTATSTATATRRPATPTIAPWPTLAPLSPDRRGLVTAGDRQSKQIALTFDVGETAANPAGYDAAIAQVLTEAEVPATFFLGGLWMEHNPDATRALARNPLFELGNHAWSHLDFSVITPAQMAEEIRLTQQTMWALLGWQTRLFRFPYGTYTEQALAVVADHGLYAIQWDVVSGDPDPAVTAESMVHWVVGQVQPGSIVIMHANGRGWHTAEALPQIIGQLREQGYQFVTVSELLALNPP